MNLKKSLPHIFFLLFLLTGIFNMQSQNTREDLEQRRQELQQEIKRINSLRSTNKKEERSVLSQVEDLDRQIRTTENLIKVTNQQANLLTRDINSNTNKIQTLRK